MHPSLLINTFLVVDSVILNFLAVMNTLSYTQSLWTYVHIIQRVSASPSGLSLGSNSREAIPALGRWGAGGTLLWASPLGAPIIALMAVNLSLLVRASLPCTGNSLGKGCISSPALSPAQSHTWLSIHIIPPSSPSSVGSSKRLTAGPCAGHLLLILAATLGSNDHVCPHFTDEETGAQKG